MPPKGYRSVALPEGIIVAIDELLLDLRKHGHDMGYTSRSEIIKEALRSFIRDNRRMYLMHPH
ncbi:MAG: hypothetical protein E3J86_14080 [Candidatus Thorarchaeota archaeon]|nr:MAG: hypothetical protein E3J86_14080 [Candidatus Thorarchaeota archaeon]